MQNFKEYLQSSKEKYPTLVINFDRHDNNKDDIENLDDVITSLNELGFPKTIELDINDKKSRRCIARLELSKSYSEQELFKICHDYINYLEKISDIKFDKASNDWYPCIVIRDTLPKGLVLGTKKCVLNFDDANNVSLSGFHKQITEFERLAIYSCNKITSGILSLLLTKNHETIFFNSTINKNSLGWVSIIEEALKNNTDILDVQEELISKGFQQLAKL